MPQVFQVLRCFKCLVFQVHQTKKSNKFKCKMCGEQQSIKRHYGLGNGQECRLHVQKLNGKRGNMGTVSDNSNSEFEEQELEEDNIHESSNQLVAQNPKQLKNSKWSVFVKDEQAEEVNDNINENMYFGNSEVVLERPKKYRKLNNKNEKNNASLKDFELENATNTYYNENKPCKFSPKENLYSIHQVTKYVETNIEQKEITNYIPQIINKKSKWAQYSEESLSQNDKSYNSPIKRNVVDICSGKTQDLQKTEKLVTENLFSLSEEYNLDSILEL